MAKGKNIKNLGTVLMLIGLATMVISYLQIDNINYVLGGLVIVSIGSFVNYFGNKQAS